MTTIHPDTYARFLEQSRKYKFRSIDIEAAVLGIYGPFKSTQYIVLPNAYWGVDLNHEADLLVITKSRLGHEVEIKVSVSDFRVDKKKYKWVADSFKQIAQFWYAMPITVYDKVKDEIPDHAGVVIVYRRGRTNMPYVIKQPQRKHKHVLKWTDEQLIKIAHLATMRVTSLRQKNAVDIAELRRDLVGMILQMAELRFPQICRHDIGCRVLSILEKHDLIEYSYVESLAKSLVDASLGDEDTIKTVTKLLSELNK